MKYIEIRNNRSQKLSTLGVLSAVALAPFFAAAEAVQAQPPGHAPAHGYYNNKGKGKKNKQDKRPQPNARYDRDGDGDYDENDRNYQNGTVDARNITINGTVMRDLRDGDRFQVRADNGRTYDVVSHDREPLRLSSGDRVQLSGHVDRDLFIAHSVRIVDNHNGGYNRPGGYGRGGGSNGDYNDGYNNGGVNQGDLSGVVTRDLSNNRFEIRADNGQTYTVRTRKSEPIRLTRGDRVVLRGNFGPSGLFVADSVRITRNDDRTFNGSRVDFSGTVVSIQSSTRLVVRGDNGRSYPVRTGNGDEFKRGDRVQVVGTAQRGSGIVIASSVTRR